MLKPQPDYRNSPDFRSHPGRTYLANTRTGPLCVSLIAQGVLPVLLPVMLLALLLGGPQRLRAQELNCQVSILTPTIQGIDQAILQQLEQDITKFMNETRWTEDEFQPIERIKCNLTITITGAPSQDRFQATAQVQAIRPVYNSTYETSTLNFNDQNFVFNYDPFTQLIVTETNYANNLAALLSYYAFLILGMDYDSFELEGGLPFFKRAQNIVNLANTSGEPGWTALSGNRNRYWVIENLLNNSYRALHQVNYLYHRKGLDIMANDPKAARDSILLGIEKLRKMFEGNPNVIMTQVFFDAKNSELVQLFSQAATEQKNRLLEALRVVDPGNLSRYNRILEN